MFNHRYHSAFELDATVVHHELGHAFAWLNDGGIVDRIRFWRTPESLLAGGMKQGLPPLRLGETSDSQLKRMRTENRDQYARRLLAGEIAARRLLDLPADEVTCDFLIDRDSDLMSSLPRLERESPDIVKALHLAHEAAGDDWYAWINSRHTEARGQIDILWEGMMAFACDIVTQLPVQSGSELVILGNKVNAAFSACTATIPKTSNR